MFFFFLLLVLFFLWRYFSTTCWLLKHVATFKAFEYCCNTVFQLIGTRQTKRWLQNQFLFRTWTTFCPSFVILITGIPGELRQRHAQKERDRSTHLRSARSDPSLVMVRPDHSARGSARMHRGRVKSPLSSRHNPRPSAYWSTSRGATEINCATCKKKSISRWIFQE